MSLLQERLKPKDQVFDNLRELMERWKNRITASNLRFVDRFLNFELQILLHIRLYSGEVGVACFEMVGPIEPTRSKKELGAEGKESPVLIDNVKIMQSPERGGERSIPVPVRFESIDSFYRVRVNSLYYSGVFGFVFGESLRNGKLDTPEFLSRNRRGINSGQLLCEVIQGGPETMNHIPRDTDGIEGEYPDRRNLTLYRDWMWSDTRILISDENVRILLGERLGGEITQALLGPFDLYPNQNKAVYRL